MARSKRFSAQARVFVRKAELDAKDSRAAGAKAEVKERARRRCSSAASKVVSLLMQQRGTLLKASKAKQAAVVAADASVSHAGTNMNTRKAVPPQNSRSGSSDPASFPRAVPSACRRTSCLTIARISTSSKSLTFPRSSSKRSITCCFSILTSSFSWSTDTICSGASDCCAGKLAS